MRRSLLRKRVMIPVASLFVIVAFLALVQATGLLFPLKGKCPTDVSDPGRRTGSG